MLNKRSSTLYGVSQIDVTKLETIMLVKSSICSSNSNVIYFGLSVILSYDLEDGTARFMHSRTR
jgi:hypothetical protein